MRCGESRLRQEKSTYSFSEANSAASVSSLASTDDNPRNTNDSTPVMRWVADSMRTGDERGMGQSVGNR